MSDQRGGRTQSTTGGAASAPRPVDAAASGGQGEVMCLCGHPVAKHKQTLLGASCSGKVAAYADTPAWVMSKPCDCGEIREAK